MEPLERDMLKRSLELSEKNNRILKKMQSAQRMSRILRLLYWIAIIFIAIAAYYFIAPYLEQAQNMYTGLQEEANAFKNILDATTGTSSE